MAITKGDFVTIEEPSNIKAWGLVQLENGVSIQPFVSIYAKERITLGEGTLVGPGVVIVDHDHNLQLPYENIRFDGIVEPVSIGKYCWIGANVTILKGVNIGDYTVIGAGSVVTRSLPSYSICYGVPARFKKMRGEP